MSPLLALAARCEAAAGPDRDIDADIAAVLDLHPRMLFDKAVLQGGEQIPLAAWDTLGCETLRGEPPRFTASLDAAVALVPSTHTWSAMAPPLLARVRLSRIVGLDPLIIGLAGDPSDAATVPLAFCAAALRARAAL